MHSARVSVWNLLSLRNLRRLDHEHVESLVELWRCYGRLDLGQVACHELPNLSWRDNAGYDAILGIIDSERWTLLVVW